MRLDRVEIVGFKSFCDKQELSFQGGVTGIVGPNGCGKSNISDAISWVLGEQSAKSLRGASMEDVIFNGSQSRQPTGMAEVNLRVSGLNGNSPDGNPECVVTRRLYRNGESEYLMNGQICRLRDIHELFMDTGLGSKAYSIIEQGKIGLILSSKPADRRALIEEAAGITKYKARRRQTQLKLEAAQQNLLRVNDIVHEVEKQLDSLKRQASKARRYRAVRDEMQTVERVLYGRRFLDLRAQSDAVAERLATEGEREQAAAIALSSEEAQMEVRRTALYEDEAQLAEVRARLGELTLAVDRHQGRSGYCREQIGETDARAAQARAEAEELRARVGPLADRLDERRSDEARLRIELAAAEDEARTAETAQTEAAARQAESEAQQDGARDAQVDLMGRIAAFQNARESVSGNAARASADLLKLAAETAEMERERTRVEGLRTSSRDRAAEADALRGELVQAREEAVGRGALARTEADGAGREAEAHQSERDSLAGRRASLDDMVATHSAFDEGVRALLAGPEGIEVLGVVADAVETDSAYERAVEAFLGDRLQAVLTPDAGHALRGIRYLQESGAGRGAFLPLASARTKAECAVLREVAAQEPSARGLLGDMYRVTGPHAAPIRASLPEALVVDSLEDALAIVSRQGPVACVTLAGETLRGSMVEGGRGVKGLLAPRREIREVSARQEQVDLLLRDARDRAQAAAARAEAAFAEVRSLEERIHAAEKDLVALRHDLASADEEMARLQRKATVLDTERGQAEQEKGAAAVRLSEIEQTLETAESDRDEGSRRLAALGTAVAEARAASDAAQARTSEAKSGLAALRERAAATEAECHRLEQDHRDLQDRIAAAEQRGAEMDARREELRGEMAEAERLLAEALGARERVAGEAAVAEDRVRDIRNELEGREAGLKERRRERDMLRDALSELEVARARTGSDLDHLGRECHQAVGMMAAEAAALITDEDRAQDLPGLEVQVQEMRERLDRMGPVNILAVEQSQELEERSTFLTAQRQDLLDSIAELDQAIKKIDRASRERFQEAFLVINQHFGDIFRQLFGGGTAGLALIDEEDILESGIDVMAQPPGKRLQNVMLLSGGEKALTAISLLFAIFQYKPSPFCILDEVDAPLDDANIGRFVRMLEGLKEQTQFVLITHSRKTMEIADQLYGVTMEEPGVSKLVSVRLS
ncbi:MAG TPA: chromosome segregation protein SMC [Vicinamibacteria bacterium]|nr:chromosome segregation protein SMC [Vicinamibacteria bacterium]